MKIYKDKTKSKSYFYYYGWAILAFLAGFFLIFFLIFQAMFYVKKTQRIDIFIAAYGVKDDNFKKAIEKEYKKDGLIEVNIYSYLESDKNLYNYFSANGEKADFIIFSETNINEMQEYVPENYVNLSALASDIPSLSKYETTEYGIKLFDGSNDEYNNKFTYTDTFEFTKEGVDKESYYLLVDKESPNFDKEKNHTLGFSVLEYFLSYHEK